MNIIIPMAGAGKRFSDAGYKVHKPSIMTVERRTGILCPMVVCATMDLPGVDLNGANVIYIDRMFHKNDNVEQQILNYYKKARFITIDQLTDGQASTCLLAKEYINNDQELLIAGCDNGMVINQDKFYKMKTDCDVLVFTYRHNECVLENPDAYGWVQVDEDNYITRLSIKKAISNTPMEDHAIVATFWFKRGADFVLAAEQMISENDRISGEFYVDKVISHILNLGLKAKAFEVERYIGWGTPKDYEEYMRTIQYWSSFIKDKRFIPKG